MHKVRRLERLSFPATERIRRLRGLVVGINPPLSPADRRTITFVAIEMANTWTLFGRSYFVSAAMEAYAPEGVKVDVAVPTFTDERAAIVHAVTSLRYTRAGEPLWQDRGVWRNVMDTLGSATLNSRVTKAATYHTTLFRDLPPCRNFFAHRSLATAAKVKGVARRNGIDPQLPAADVLSSAPTGGSQQLVVDWLDDLQAIVEILTDP